MKRNFYLPFVLIKSLSAFILAFMLMCGVTAKAQTYVINFGHAPPAVGDPLLDQNDCPPFGGAPCTAIEVGVRFRVTVPGNVTAIRFFKGTGQGGEHKAHLWNNDGTTQYAQETFIELPGSDGWQEVALTTPVHITPGQNYVASVYNANGDYQSDANGAFNWTTSDPLLPAVIPADFGSDPIRVIRTTNDPAGNGLYIYLINPGFENGAFPNLNNGNNYWIDLRFLPDSPLPVTLSGLRAITTNNDVSLNWKTESEFNNKGFEIQRSNNGADWYAVNFVNGTGESPTVRNYSYTDKGLAPGLYYYRLKQIDNDGKFKNSAVVTATVSGKGRIVLFQNSPNPFRGSATIRFDLPNAQKVRLSIFDILGREVKVLANKLSEAGSHIIPVDGTGLSRQLYYIRLQTESGTLTRNMLLVE